MRVKVVASAFMVVFYVIAGQALECAWGEDLSAGKKKSSILSEQWLSAVAANDLQTALVCAANLVGEPSRPIPREHVKLSEDEGMTDRFLIAPFDRWDFQLWRDAYFFRHLSEEITKGDQENVERMFKAVRERIASREDDAGATVPWPYRVWQRGFGVCDRQAWLLCELAYQAGWETQVVYLGDPETKEFQHTVCEFRRPDGSVYFADPYGGVLFPQRSAQSLAADKDLLQTIWVDHPEWRRGPAHSVFLTPSYPQDYRPHNQDLYVILQKNLQSRCPRFGSPPDERLATYRRLARVDGRVNGSGSLPFPMELWSYPMRLLREDIKRYANQGHAFYTEGRYKEAIVHYSESVYIMPGSAAVHYEWGDSLEKQGMLQEAIDHYHEAMMIRPGFTDAREHLIRVLEAVKKGKPVS